MNRREFLHATSAGVATMAVPDSPLSGKGLVTGPDPLIQSNKEQVNFGYAFAPPHRITVARPEASEKTLLDLQPSLLSMTWSYGDLRTEPLCAFKTPLTGPWRINVKPLMDGKPLLESSWKRGEDFLPMLDALYSQPQGQLQLEAIGAASGALFRVTARNFDTVAHHFSVASEVLGGWINHNPAWIDDGVNSDVLVAGAGDRSDRILLFGVGAERFPVDKNSITLEWTLNPGETRSGWLVRTYNAYEQDLTDLRRNDWSGEFDAAKTEWRNLFGKAMSIQIPDDRVRNAFYACLGDLFIMREPLAAGYMGTVCGTEAYRAPGPLECILAAIALDQTRLHAEAANGLRVHLEMQEPDGNWDDPRGWNHHMWGTAGFKAWAGVEHFRLTGDRSYLEQLFPRLVANSRWQETQRQKSRGSKGKRGDGSFGLMPRGMGDSGLMNGSDYFGVFFPHNFLAVFADALAIEAAEILGRADGLPDLRRIHESGLTDLIASLRNGAINERDFEWIPGSFRNLAGSRYGALFSVFPTRILEPQDSLVVGTLKKIEQHISRGGQPVHTGWMIDGAWVAITLDNLAETHLALGNGDAAIAYLYSTLNHGTPLFTWCEERGIEPGTKKISGDKQHLYTPVAVVRFLRDALIMEQTDGLHLGLATARAWLRQGRTVGVREAPTHFGNVTYEIKSDVERGSIRALIEPPTREQCSAIVLHLRHPLRKPIQRVTVNGAPFYDFDASNEALRFVGLHETVHVEAHY